MNTMLDLGRMNQVPVDMTLEGLAALNRTKQSDEIGLQELMRQQQFNQQADPMRLQQMSVANETSLQNLHQLKRNNREADELSPHKVMAEYKGYLQRAGEADIAMAEQKWREMAMSNDPKIADLGKRGLATTKDFIMQKMKDDADMARVRQQGANQLAVANVGAASREKVAALAAAARREQAQLKTPKDWQEYAVRQQMLLTQEDDAEARRALEQNILYAQTMAERLRPPQQVMNPELTGGMQVDPRGAVPTPPAAKPNAAQHSMSQLRSMYPGRSDAEIREAYKKRFGVEPQ